MSSKSGVLIFCLLNDHYVADVYDGYFVYIVCIAHQNIRIWERYLFESFSNGGELLLLLKQPTKPFFPIW